MDFPFIGGRVKADSLTRSLAEKLPVTLEVKETRSPTKAWQNVQHHLTKEKAVGLKLDWYHLEYFAHPFHFAGYVRL